MNDYFGSLKIQESKFGISIPSLKIAQFDKILMSLSYLFNISLNIYSLFYKLSFPETSKNLTP